jgi:hypothetical protein
VAPIKPAAPSSAAKAPLALRDISNTTAATTTSQAPAAGPSTTTLSKPSAASSVINITKPPAPSQTERGAGGSHNNYEISDREDSSDEDYESDGDNNGNRKDAKRVPEWAKGPALKEVGHLCVCVGG